LKSPQKISVQLFSLLQYSYLLRSIERNTTLLLNLHTPLPFSLHMLTAQVLVLTPQAPPRMTVWLREVEGKQEKAKLKVLCVVPTFTAKPSLIE